FHVTGVQTCALPISERGERGPQVGAPAQRARHAQAVDDALAPPAVESLRAVEGLDALLVGRDVLGLAGGPVPLGVQDCALRQARLDALAARGVRVPDDEADGG